MIELGAVRGTVPCTTPLESHFSCMRSLLAGVVQGTVPCTTPCTTPASHKRKESIGANAF